MLPGVESLTLKRIMLDSSVFTLQTDKLYSVQKD